MKNNFLIEPLESRIAPAAVFAIEAGTNHLVSFDTAHPNVLTQDVVVTGLSGTQVVVGLDFDQGSGTLFAFAVQDNGATRSGRAYTLDPHTGVATPLGGVTFNALADTGTYGLDIDPSNRAIQLTNAAGANFGVIANGSFNGKTLDEPGVNENISAIAYDQNFDSAHTTLYGYNFLTDELVTVGSVNQAPDDTNSGIVHKVAKATVNGVAVLTDSAAIGFDIAGPVGAADQGWLSLSQANSTHFYQANLQTGALTDLGTVGDGTRHFSELTVSLEAPAPTIVGNKATWTDIDGDLVTLTVSKGKLSASNFHMVQGVNGSALQSLTLDATFAGADILIKAKPGPLGGDGAVNVGSITGKSTDLGNVTVPGDLVQIDAGNAAAPAPSLKSLNVRSLGALHSGLRIDYDTASSDLADGVGKIMIDGDLGTHLGLGNRVSGSVSIGGDLRGGDDTASGDLTSQAAIGKLIVKGSLRGGTGSNSGAVFAPIIGSVTIGGSLIGDAGSASGSLRLVGLGTTVINVGGSLLGGSTLESGSIEVRGLSTVNVHGDVHGGAGLFSGSIYSSSAGSFLKSATIGGSLIGGDQTSGVFVNRIGTLHIKGDVEGTAAQPVLIAASLANVAQTQAASLGIAQLTIDGNLEYGRIGAGVDNNFAGANVDAALGTIKIGKNMIASSIVAGIDQANGAIGDGDDKLTGGNAGSSAVIARIAGITVGGQLYGTPGGVADTFGIEAEQIGFIKIGATKLALNAQKNDLTVGFTGDVHVKEF